MILNRSKVASSETPLRRSVVGNYRESVGNQILVNDDEEERRQARRRTMLQNVTNNNNNKVISTPDSTITEESEKFKKCMEIYNGNKLSRANAWNLSLIDTLATLINRHHKTLNNLKVAGSSLEASSKVYGLRVDSVYMDVLRMSAGINARKFDSAQSDDDTDKLINSVDTTAADENRAEADAATENTDDGKTKAQAKQKKRARKPVSTVTKNKESLNARLETVALNDPIFAKLNFVQGSINSSNRLMNNVLHTVDSELQLCTNYKFWDATDLEVEKKFYNNCKEISSEYYNTKNTMDATFVIDMKNYENLLLRPMHSGYAITDTPLPINNREKTPNYEDVEEGRNMNSNLNEIDTNPTNVDFFDDQREISMAFDMNAVCEPMPELEEPPLVLAVDYNDFEALEPDDRTVLNSCRVLRKQAVVIEDLRPVDAESCLEYSYRPMDKISQFWAGPSHWKFRRTQIRNSTLSDANEQSSAANKTKGKQQNNRRVLQLQAKRKQIDFFNCYDDLFINITEHKKLRKVNVQKRWDSRKLKLPTNLNIEKNCFFKYEFAPGLKHQEIKNEDDDAVSVVNCGSPEPFGEHFVEDYNDGLSAGMSDTFANDLPNQEEIINRNTTVANMETLGPSNRIDCNSAILEIATDFEGAPKQVTKIVVPFAKRAKIIDMKMLKSCCHQIINHSFKVNAASTSNSDMPPPPTASTSTTGVKNPNEKYAPGVTTFKDIYHKLPDMLTPTMKESLSPAIAFYSILHLSNDYNLRLEQQSDLGNFYIRQVTD